MSIDGAEAWGPVYRPEGENLSGRISFQAGSHRENSDSTVAAINEGNVHRSVWNKELEDRVSAGVIAVDSLPAILKEDLGVVINAKGESIGEDYKLEDKKKLLAWSPVRGREVIIVSGDISYRDPASDFTRYVTDGEDREKKKKELTDAGKERNDNERSEFLPELIAENAATATVGLLGALLIYELAKLNERKSDSSSPFEKKLSRRKFLDTSWKAAAGATVLYVGGRGLAGVFIQNAPNNTMYNIGERILEMTAQPKLFEQNWLDGRTALLIEKCNTALRQGITSPDTKGEVVMGNAHALESSKLLKSAEERKKAIHALSSDLVSFYDRVLDDFPTVNKPRAINRMLDWICQGDMVAVKGFEQDHIDKEAVDRTVRENIQYIGSFMTPSVLAAVSDLRMPEDTQKLDELVKKNEVPAVSTPTPEATPAEPTPVPTKVAIPKAP